MEDKIYRKAMDVKKMNRAVYNSSTALFSVLSRLCLDVSAKYESEMPKKSAILAFNHCLKFDPFMLGNYTERPIHFWIQYEGIYNNPLRAAYLNAIGGIPVITQRANYRRNLRELFKTTRWWLDNSDDYIGIFTDSEIKDVCAEISCRDHYPGAAYLALASGKPIVPVSIWSPKRIVKESKDAGRSIFSNFMFMLRNRPIPVNIGFGNPIEPKGDKCNLASLVHQEQARVYHQIRED